MQWNDLKLLPDPVGVIELPNVVNELEDLSEAG
jgi:hypothetical protein